MTAIPPGGPIYQASIAMAEWAPLNVHLIKGTEYAVWVDSGIRSMFPLLKQTMREAGVANSQLQFVLHTHSHHDHIGCNAQLKQETGCLIAAPEHYARWHSDFEFHYQDFARPFPHLVPDTEALRSEVFDVLDAPQPVDVFVDENFQANLGGGVTLKAYSLPGHLLAELGWFEASSRTLILGDAVTMLTGPQYHSHLDVQAYRSSLNKIERLLHELSVELVLFAHFPPMKPAAVRELLQAARAYIDTVEGTVIRILAGTPRVTMEELWVQTCERTDRLREFRSLNMVAAHIKDLSSRGIVREVAHETYSIV